MPNKVTIYDIAEKLNITAATVSRALNNNAKIKESTKELVLATAAQMGYKQNRLAQALKSGRSNVVGVIVPRIDSNFFASAIRGIEDELSPQGYQVVICQTHDDVVKEKENLITLLDTQVDGIIMSLTDVKGDNNDSILKVLESHVPLVFFDRKKDFEGVSSVTINDFRGGYIATKHLIDQGCKKIAHFSRKQPFEIFQNRFLGYKQALVDHNFEYDENYVIEVNSDLEEGREAVRKLMSLAVLPDAIFSSSDFAALGAIQELKERGFEIPKDICVVGFSNEPFTKFMELSITSVDQSPLEMGKMAARVFLEQLQSKETIKMEKMIVLSPELHIRKSSNRNLPVKE
ncbi:LacI family DNA-binding transcriptional regulator [Flavobacterium sp. RSSA_27]|uniref:LacI family DNA-binding transcriptional regulator n=1 Tax=Flavobacterium sp. RSSA_27 TaxID=3447667 RepID=UPI003F2C8708